MRIKIQGADYPFPGFDTLSYKEAKIIKQETGLVMGQFFKALEDGDPDALMAVALIAKLREDKTFNAEALYDLLLTDIEVIVEEADNQAAPLGEPAPESPEAPSE